MTVIFHTNAGLPVLAGDMLISKPGPSPFTNLKLPSHPNGIVIPSNPLPKIVPATMRRKIFIVNEHLAVGAAGDVMSIQTLLDHLFGAFGNKPGFSAAEIEESLLSYASTPAGRDVFRQVHLLASVQATDRTGSLACVPIGQPDSEFASERFGTVTAIGSGSDVFLDRVRELDGYAVGGTQPQDGNVSFPEFGPLQANLALLARVYWQEFVSPQNLFDGWGGAYELIYQDPGWLFQHLTDYTLFLRVYDAAEPHKGIQPRGVMKYGSQQSASYIATLTSKGLEFFGATDITDSNAPAAIKFVEGEFTMRSKFHVSIIAVCKGKKFISLIVQTEAWDPDGRSQPHAQTWFDEEGRLCVWFSTHQDQWLQEQATALYSRYAEASYK